MNDLISRAAAIKAMADLEQEDIERYSCSIPEGFDGKRAIEALQKLPSVTQKVAECEDAISRNMALSEVKSGMIRTIDGENWKRVNDNVRDILALPSVTPKQKMGRWIEHNQHGINHIECSSCSAWVLSAYLVRKSYCPNCGAKMERECEVK